MTFKSGFGFFNLAQKKSVVMPKPALQKAIAEHTPCSRMAAAKPLSSKQEFHNEHPGQIFALLFFETNALLGTLFYVLHPLRLSCQVEQSRISPYRTQ